MDFIEMGLLIAIPFIMERSWECHLSKKNFNNLKNQVLEEIDYNCSSAVGTPLCHFRLDLHKEFAKEIRLDKETKLLVNDIINAALKSNAYARMSFQIDSYNVKNMSQRLKEKLLKID